MAQHDDLLNQGPREAPEAETAEEKSKKLGLKSGSNSIVVINSKSQVSNVFSLTF